MFEFSDIADIERQSEWVSKENISHGSDWKYDTVWKVSVRLCEKWPYSEFSDPRFPAFRMSTPLRIHSALRKTQTRITSNKGHFLRSANDKNQIELASVEDPLNMHRTSSNGTTLFSEIQNKSKAENVIIALG